jgi:hypothetical protein
MLGQPSFSVSIPNPTMHVLCFSHCTSQERREMTENSNTSHLANGTGRFRPGERRVGRKPGVPNIATREIKAAAQLYGEEAIERLVALMRGEDPNVALKAANALLDRAYGKAPVAIVGEPEQPLEHNVAGIDEFMRRIAAMAERVAA